jgi:hypothetical protein
VDANHLRRDDEGFRPSDLARLAGDNELHAWLVAVENAYDEEEAKAEAKQKAPPAPKKKRAPVAYALYPPTTFYGAASVGDVSLLAKILNEDVYSVNDDIAGVGSVLHVAVARGHAGLVKAILRGELANGERADVNKPSSGAFGLTPLHLAATLFARRETFARASRDLEDAETELERLRARDRTGVGASERESRHAAARDKTKQKKHVRREEKDALKQKKRDAHLKAAEARKVLAVEAAGALDAVRIYRLLLQAGADVEAIAKVPAKCVFAGTETAQRRRDGTLSRKRSGSVGSFRRGAPRPRGRRRGDGARRARARGGRSPPGSVSRASRVRRNALRRRIERRNSVVPSEDEKKDATRFLTRPDASFPIGRRRG